MILTSGLQGLADVKAVIGPQMRKIWRVQRRFLLIHLTPKIPASHFDRHAGNFRDDTVQRYGSNLLFAVLSSTMLVSDANVIEPKSYRQEQKDKVPKLPGINGTAP